MRDLLLLAIHLLVTLAKLLRPGDVRAVAAESLVLKHQLLICNRSRQRAPNLTTFDRFVLGLTGSCLRRMAHAFDLKAQPLALNVDAGKLRTLGDLPEQSNQRLVKVVFGLHRAGGKHFVHV